MDEKLLSIIIPTKDREYYCKRVLDYMLTFSDDRIEYVIQNNGKSNELDEYIKEKNDCRIVYKHIYEPLCQVDNSDRSIEIATGRYLCFIGDDDIVFPNIMQFVEYAIENNIDNIAQRNPVAYTWPSDQCPQGKLSYTIGNNREEVLTDMQGAVRKFVRNGCCKNPKDFNLPVLYHGITKRQCIEEVKKETGHYVGGSSPDSFTSVALAKYVKKQVIVDKNFSIFGACPQSATAINLVGGHCGKLEDAPHLKNRGLYEWDHLIPRYYSVQTIWAESAITALRETNNPEAENVNLMELFCMSYLRNKTIRQLIIDQTNINNTNNNINKPLFWCGCAGKLLFKETSRIFKGVYGRLLRYLKVSRLKTVYNVKDICDCVEYVC